MKTYNYLVYSPNGNITALVEGIPISAAEKELINYQIMNSDSTIEQVGFIEKKNLYYRDGRR